MKTKIFTGVLIAGLLFTSSSYAMYGNGQGNGQQKGKNKSGECNFSIENIEKQNVSEEEILKLQYQYSEEKLARDMYNYFYELYGTQVFKNIAESEQKHMDAVKLLLDRYEISIPSDFGELEDEYNSLKNEGGKSLKNALEVGVKIEILDIEDIVKTIKLTDNDDIKTIFLNIGGASYNHMRGFLKAINQNNLETEIDYSNYLNSSDINTKGTLKDKILLKLDGVNLPESNLKGSEKVKSKNREVKGLTTKTRNAVKNSINKLEKSLLKYNESKRIEKYELVKSKLEKALEKILGSENISEGKKDKYKNIINDLLNNIDERILEIKN